MSTLGSLFPLEKPKAQRDPLDEALCWPEGGQCTQSETTPPYPLPAVLLGPLVPGWYSTLTPQFWGFCSSGLSGVLLVYLLLRETKIRSNLCHYLNDVTSLNILLNTYII